MFYFYYYPIILPLRSFLSSSSCIPIGRNLPEFYRIYFLIYFHPNKIPFFLLNSCILKINIKIIFKP